MSKYLKIIQERCDNKNYNKLIKIKNKYLFEFVANFIELFNPGTIFVCDDSKKDFD